MGLGISSSLIDAHLSPTLGHLPAEIMLSVATLVALALSISFIKYRKPGFNAKAMPAWGMVSMGILALGSAYSLILDAWLIHTVCWAIGGVLSVITCIKYLKFLVLKRPDSPAFTWGLPLVAPMVTATSSAQLAPQAGEWGSIVHGIGVFCFSWLWSQDCPCSSSFIGESFPRFPPAWLPPPGSHWVLSANPPRQHNYSPATNGTSAPWSTVSRCSASVSLYRSMQLSSIGEQPLVTPQCPITPRGGPAPSPWAPAASAHRPYPRNPPRSSGV